jgi:hypothetical protein
MRPTSLVLTLAFVAAVGAAANADTMMGSPKPSPSAMHSSMMKSNHMKATPKPSAMHGSMMSSHTMGSPKPKASSRP